MLYAFLGSLAVGIITSLYLLWRNSQLKTQIAIVQGQLAMKTNECRGWEASYDLAVKTSRDSLASSNAQIKTLGDQNALLLKELEKSGVPGVFAELLQKRNTAGVPNPT